MSPKEVLLSVLSVDNLREIGNEIVFDVMGNRYVLHPDFHVEQIIDGNAEDTQSAALIEKTLRYEKEIRELRSGTIDKLKIEQANYDYTQIVDLFEERVNVMAKYLITNEQSFLDRLKIIQSEIEAE